MVIVRVVTVSTAADEERDAAVADEVTALVLPLASEGTDSSFKISRQFLVPALGIVGEYAGLLPKSLAVPSSDVGQKEVVPVLVRAGSRKTNLAGVIYLLIHLSRTCSTSHAR